MFEYAKSFVGYVWSVLNYTVVSLPVKVWMVGAAVAAYVFSAAIAGVIGYVIG